MSTAPTRQDVIELDQARKNRRERLAEKFDSAKAHLAPAALVKKVGREQKARLNAAGQKAGQFSRDHKYAVAGGVATVLVAAAAAGLFFYRRGRTAGLEGESITDTGDVSAAEMQSALADSNPIAGVPAASAAGSTP